MADNIVRRKFQKSLIVDGNNNNKFYLYEYDPVTEILNSSWGRVGDAGESKNWGRVSPSRFDAMCEHRMSVKGYVEVGLQTVEVQSTPSLVAASDPSLVQITEWIFKESGEHIKSYLAGSVDAMSVLQIRKGQAVLDRINQNYKTWKPSQLLLAIQEYYNVIPTQLPRRIDPDTIVAGFLGAQYERVMAGLVPATGFDEQGDRLQQLEAAVGTVTAQAAVPSASQYDTLGATLKRVDFSSPLYSVVLDLLEQQLKHNHARIDQVYEVLIPGERKAYEAQTRGARREEWLFHGTRGANIRHICKTGLIMPKSPSSGWRLGPGIYHANDARKSYNYISSNVAPRMIFIDRVKVGIPWETTRDDSSMRQAPPGYDSTWAMWNYQEIVVYDPSQVTVSLLVVLK